ncbi:MAG: hypothetical protein PHH54_05385 [Candidatus Nanoarchaeia archaeon]|nr:hypothetical protein [Candidatus Nanoarchaeia archaeon]MDD5741391.1 hypothetical protein [Candidatus Nanoarchaeia archaeon]
MISVNPNLRVYYNLAGKYTESERKFKKYLKNELRFYQKLSEEAIRLGRCGLKGRRPSGLEDPLAYL